MKIKFTQEYKVKDAEGTFYAVGDTLVCSDSTAEHFMTRGVAVPAGIDAVKEVLGNGGESGSASQQDQASQNQTAKKPGRPRKA